MVELHTARGGRALTSAAEYGGGAPAPLYGEPGELCAAGCGTVLRRTNPWDTCAACEAAGHKGTPRARVKRCEEAKVKKAEEQKRRDQEAILAYLQGHAGTVVKRAELEEHTGLAGRAIGQHVGRLRVAGHAIDVTADYDRKVFEYVYHSQKTAPVPQAAPAPELSREQSAEVAAEVPPVPSPPAADTEHDAVLSEITELELVAPDLELYVLQLLADLDPEARERVLQFAVAKWWLT